MRAKRIALIGGGAVLLLALVAIAAVLLVDLNQYRSQIASRLQEALNRPVTLGGLGVSLWPVGVRVEELTINESPAFATGRVFAKVRELYVRPRLLPLLRGAFELDA